MPESCSHKPDSPTIIERIDAIQKTTDRIEACLIGSYEQPGGLVARIVAVEKAQAELRGVPERLTEVENVTNEVKGFKRWVISAIGGALVTGGIFAKIVSDVLKGGGGPPTTQGP